jgi:hypothetical protein
MVVAEVTVPVVVMTCPDTLAELNVKLLPVIEPEKGTSVSRL